MSQRDSIQRRILMKNWSKYTPITVIIKRHWDGANQFQLQNHRDVYRSKYIPILFYSLNGDKQ